MSYEEQIAKDREYVRQAAAEKRADAGYDRPQVAGACVGYKAPPPNTRSVPAAFVNRFHVEQAAGNMVRVAVGEADTYYGDKFTYALALTRPDALQLALLLLKQAGAKAEVNIVRTPTPDEAKARVLKPANSFSEAARSLDMPVPSEIMNLEDGARLTGG